MRLSIYLFFLFSFSFLLNEAFAKNTLSGINPEEFNYLTRPQDSLYDHINSDWLNNTPIPDDQIGWGSYMTLGDCPICNAKDAYGDQCEKCGSTLSPEELKNPKSTISDSDSNFKRDKTLLV